MPYVCELTADPFFKKCYFPLQRLTPLPPLSQYRRERLDGCCGRLVDHDGMKDWCSNSSVRQTINIRSEVPFLALPALAASILGRALRRQQHAHSLIRALCQYHLLNKHAQKKRISMTSDTS